MGVSTLRTVSHLPFSNTCPTQMGISEHILLGSALHFLRPKLPALTNPQIFVGDGGGRLGGFRLVPGFVSSPCSGRTGGVFIRIISAVERQETRELVTEEGKTKVSGGRFDMGVDDDLLRPTPTRPAVVSGGNEKKQHVPRHPRSLTYVTHDPR